MIEDLTSDDDDGAPKVGAAFITGGKAGPAELLVMEQAYRNDGFEHVLFTRIDPETGAEVWDDGQPNEGQRWQRIMNWPREPTIEEAMQFQAYKRGAGLAKWWERLKAARAQDERASAAGSAAGSGGGPSTSGAR